MKIFDVEKLSAQDRLTIPIFDLATAAKLCDKGGPLTVDMITAIHNAGIKKVAILSPGESEVVFRQSIIFKALPLANIPVGENLAYDVYTSGGKLLLNQGTKLTEGMINSLGARDISEILVRRELKKGTKEKLFKARDKISSIKEEIAKMKVAEFEPNELLAEDQTLDGESVEKMATSMESSGGMNVKPDKANALNQHIKTIDNLIERQEIVKTQYSDLYNIMVQEASDLFKTLQKADGKINGTMLGRMTERVVSALVADRELLLNTMYLTPDLHDYLAQHAVNVTIISVNIAAASDFSKRQILELGYAALLADVGMLKVPPEIRFKEERLTPVEQMEIQRHTLYGIDILQTVRNLPLTAPIVSFQSHERLDGSGYPHGKKTYTIHDYAKIVAIADVYDAQVGARPYRKQVRLPYAAIEEVLRMSSINKLDLHFTRKLLSVISLFPIGSWVKLNTGETAKVLSAHGNAYTKPTVAILYDKDGNSCEAKRVDLSDEQNAHIQIVSATQMASADPMAGF